MDSSIIKEAITQYASCHDEQAALLAAGAPFDELDDYLHNAKFRRAVTLVDAQAFANAVSTLKGIAADTRAQSAARVQAAKTLGDWFGPEALGDARSDRGVAEPWPDRPADSASG